MFALLKAFAPLLMLGVVAFAIAFVRASDSTDVTVYNGHGTKIGTIRGRTVYDANGHRLGYTQSGKTYSDSGDIVATPEVPGILFCKVLK